MGTFWLSFPLLIPKLRILNVKSAMQLKQAIPIALTAALAYAQEDSGSGSSGMTNLTALLSNTDSLSSLNDLVGNYPDFAATLASWENVTILAPSNDALETLMNSDAGSMLDNDQFVQSLLRYHVLQSTVYASDVTQTPVFAPTYLNSSMYSNVTVDKLSRLACRMMRSSSFPVSSKSRPWLSQTSTTPTVW